MMRHVLGEDLKVGCCLTWGPCFDYQKRFFTGKPDNVSKYPYLLRYDVEVSGFGSHASGHLNLLKLKEQIYPGGDSKKHWPTLGMNTLRWAKKQGGITGPAHSGNGLTRMIGRIEGVQDGPHGLPNFNIPAYDGIGANEYIVDATHTVPGPDGRPVPALDFISAMDTDRVAEWNMWYHTLNCGYRIRVSGETAPLLFTALNNQFFSTNMNAPMANLPVVIFQFAMSPSDNWVNLAWGGALIITFAVLGLNILARVVLREKVSV